MKRRRLNPNLRITQDAEERHLRQLVATDKTCMTCVHRIGLITAIKAGFEKEDLGAYGYCLISQVELDDYEPCEHQEDVGYVSP